MNNNKILKNRYVKNFFKDKYLILKIILIMFAWAIIFLCVFYQPKFKSTARVLIKDISNETYVKANDSENSDIKPLTESGNPVFNQIELLSSQELSKYIYAEIQKKYPDEVKNVKIPDKLAKTIIKAKNKMGTDTIDIDLAWNNADNAQAFLTIALDGYKKINLDINKEIRTNRRTYIDKNITDIENKLLEVRDKIKTYREGSLAIDVYEESKQSIAQKSDFVSKLETVSADIKSQKSTVKEIENQLSLKAKDAINAVALGSDNETLSDLRSKLNEISQQYAFDLIKNSPTNPKMVALQNQITLIKAQIQSQISLTLGKPAKKNQINIYDSVRTKLVTDLAAAQSNLMGLEAQERSIKTTINKINKVQEKMPLTQYTLDNLRQDESNLAMAYDELRKKQIEAKIKEAEAVSNIVVIDAPSKPLFPSFPSRFHILFLSLMLGGFLGIAASTVKTYIEDICDDVESIEEVTKSSILGVIPWLNDKEDPSINYKIQQAAYKKILSKFVIKCYKRDAKVIAFSSTSLVKSNSNTLYTMALELKKQGHSVVIVDADLRNPTIINQAEFDNDIQFNLSDIILAFEKKLKNKEFIDANDFLSSLKVDKNGITVLANKESVSDPYEFFGTAAFEAMISILKQNYEWVLIDTAPILVAPEFLLISSVSDVVALMANLTVTYNMLSKITRMLKDTETPLIGTIVREKDSSFEKEYIEYIACNEHSSDRKKNTETITENK
ncbi:MAG: GNVR domain-containing protein [bacterium]